MEQRDYNNIEYLPKALKQLLQREDLHIKTCGNCLQPGLLRCARCRCQYYCSPNCQRAHFEHHKRNCKSIGKARRKIEIQYNDVVAVGRAAQLTAKLKLTVFKINLADLLVKVAYEECDTIVQGRIFYREALKIYAHPLTGDLYFKYTGYQKLFTFIEERLMLMVIACGGDTKELEPVFMNCGGYDVDADSFRRKIAASGIPSGSIDLVKCDVHTAYFLTRGMLTKSNQDCYRWHFFWLLAYMLKLSKYRENIGRLDVFRSALNEMILDNSVQGLPGDDAIAEHVSKYLIGEEEDYFATVLPGNINQAINGIRMNNHEDDLVRLKHAEPFKRELSPGLFPGIGNVLEWMGEDDELRLTPMDMTMMLSEISFGGGAPPECWMIYQKCIIESFQGGEIVQEFIEG